MTAYEMGHKLYDPNDSDLTAIGCCVQYVFQKAKKLKKGEKDSEFEYQLGYAVAAAEDAKERNGDGMPKGYPDRLLKIKADYFGESKPTGKSSRDRLVDKVRGSRAKQKTESK